MAKWIEYWTQDQKVWSLISGTSHVSTIQVSDKLYILHCIGLPNRNEYLIKKSKIILVVAGCICAYLAGLKVQSDEHAKLWMFEL